jgi:hypothetical protein
MNNARKYKLHIKDNLTYKLSRTHKALEINIGLTHVDNYYLCSYKHILSQFRGTLVIDKHGDPRDRKVI